MAASTLAASYTDLQGVDALALGWNRTVASWSSTETADWGRINREAYRQAVYPEPLDGERVGHLWSWLRPKGTLTLNVPYATGTVTVAADGAGSIVTLVDGTWPSWAAAGVLWVDDGSYTVLSRTSDSVIRLDNVSVTVAAGTSYELIQHDYDLATDFGGMDSNAFTYRRDQSASGLIQVIGESDFRREDRQSLSTGTPLFCSVIPVAPTSTNDARWQVMFAPLASEVWELEYRYVAIPPLLDGSTYVYHYGGAPYSNLFIASYRERAFKLLRDSDEGLADYERALRSAVMYDRATHSLHTMGTGPNSYGARSFDYDTYTRDRRSSTYQSITFADLV